jgi:hypothetical protein
MVPCNLHTWVIFRVGQNHKYTPYIADVPCGENWLWPDLAILHTMYVYTSGQSHQHHRHHCEVHCTWDVPLVTLLVMYTAPDKCVSKLASVVTCRALRWIAPRTPATHTGWQPQRLQMPSSMPCSLRYECSVHLLKLCQLPLARSICSHRVSSWRCCSILLHNCTYFTLTLAPKYYCLYLAFGMLTLSRVSFRKRV